MALVPLWAPLLLASWMAVAFRPWHAKLAQKVGGRSGAAAVATVSLVLALLLPVLVIGLSLVGAALSLAEQLQRSAGAKEGLQTLLESQPELSGGLNMQRISELLQSHGGGAWKTASMIFGAASSAVIGMFVFVYGFYVCLVDGGRAYRWLIDHCPLEPQQTERLALAYEETGRGLLIGVGLTALVQGAVATLGYVIIGVPQALVLGLLTALAALIPSFGTGLIWAPLAIGLLAAGRTGAAVAVLGVGCAISVLDNFVRPLFSRRGHLQLSSFVLLVAMLGGMVAFGTWGLLLGPLFVRLSVEALRLGRERRELGAASPLIETGNR